MPTIEALIKNKQLPDNQAKSKKAEEYGFGELVTGLLMGNLPVDKPSIISGDIPTGNALNFPAAQTVIGLQNYALLQMDYPADRANPEEINPQINQTGLVAGFQLTDPEQIKPQIISNAACYPGQYPGLSRAGQNAESLSGLDSEASIAVTTVPDFKLDSETSAQLTKELNPQVLKEIYPQLSKEVNPDTNSDANGQAVSEQKLQTVMQQAIHTVDESNHHDPAKELTEAIVASDLTPNDSFEQIPGGRSISPSSEVQAGVQRDIRDSAVDSVALESKTLKLSKTGKKEAGAAQEILPEMQLPSKGFTAELAKHLKQEVSHFPANSVHELAYVHHQKLKSFQVKLLPEHLGNMLIKVSLEDGQLNTQITVANNDAVQILTHQLGELRQALLSEGLTPGQMDVNLQQNLGQGSPDGRAGSHRESKEEEDIQHVEYEYQADSGKVLNVLA